MIVVDTNVLAYLLIPGDRTSAAESIYKKDPDWLAPTLWEHELTNVLCLYVRKGLLPIDHAVELERRAHEVIRPYLRPSIRRVVELSVRTRCSGYDCEFAALAQEMGLPLITVDRKLLQAFPDFAVSMEGFLQQA